MATIGGHDIELSNSDKVFFPDTGLTKGDLVDYYRRVAEVMVPHTRRYGVSMQRFPDGLDGGGFYQKDASDYFPEWIHTAHVPKREGGSYDAPVIDSEATLVYLANQAMMTPHLYLSRIDDLEKPDKMIYDLDPPEGTEDFRLVRQAAVDVRDTLDELDLPAFVKTTGSKGYHVVVPVRLGPDFETVRQFARDVARVLEARKPDTYTLESRKNKRKGRIFLDMLRNAYGATAVAPYSVRPRPGAPVATPLEWDELASGADPRDWTLRSIPRRLSQKDDPWKHLMQHAHSLDSRRQKLDRLLDEAGIDGE